MRFVQAYGHKVTTNHTTYFRTGSAGLAARYAAPEGASSGVAVHARGSMP
jgi:hypothetical protein